MNNSKNINNTSKSHCSSSSAVNTNSNINNSTSFSFSSINSSSSSSFNSNTNSSSETSNTNSKLVNSKSNNISFGKSQIDNNHNNNKNNNSQNQIPVIIEHKSRTIEPTNQLRHSASVSSQKSSVSDINNASAAASAAAAAAAASSTGLPTHRHQKIVVQASTSDLLNCFAIYISEKCGHLVNEPYVNPLTYMNSEIGKRVKFEPKDTVNWLRSADRALLVQGWQEIAFMNPVNVVFVYLLVRDTLRVVDVNSVYELQCNVMACLYLAFSYMGNEISYPLKPFLIEENREIFWQRTVDLMNNLSGCMLRINRDPRFFTEMFYELKSYSLLKTNEPMKIPLSVSSSSANLLSTNDHTNNKNNINNNSSVINSSSSSINRNHHNSFKQLTDQINSIEIKIDSYTQQQQQRHQQHQKQQQQNKHNDEQISSKNVTSQEKSSFNSFKPTLSSTDLTKVRPGHLYMMMGSNENEKPINSYCV